MFPFRPPMDGVSRLRLNFGGMFLPVMPSARRTNVVTRSTVDKLLREPPASSFCISGEIAFKNKLANVFFYKYDAIGQSR